MSTGRPSMVRLAIRPPIRRPRSSTTTGSPASLSSRAAATPGDAGADHDDWIHLLMLSGPSTSSGRRRCRNNTQGPAKEHPLSDMSKESAPTGGDPLEIVPDLTEGDDAAPGDEAGLSDESESSPPPAAQRCGRGRRSRRRPGPAESRWHPTRAAGRDVRLGQRIRSDAGYRRHQRLSRSLSCRPPGARR